MSQENIQIVRSAFDAYERGDVAQIVALMSDDLVTHRIEPENAVYHGKQGFFEATADWTEDFEEWTAVAEEFVDAGDAVLVRVHQTALGEASGVPVESDFWFLFEMDEGKVVRLSFHPRRASAFEAAGVPQ